MSEEWTWELECVGGPADGERVEVSQDVVAAEVSGHRYRVLPYNDLAVPKADSPLSSIVVPVLAHESFEPPTRERA